LIHGGKFPHKHSSSEVVPDRVCKGKDWARMPRKYGRKPGKGMCHACPIA
jgi:hypothetical protein